MPFVHGRRARGFRVEDAAREQVSRHQTGRRPEVDRLGSEIARHTRDHEQRSHGLLGRNPDPARHLRFAPGNACSSRQAAARSGNSRSALKGGAPCLGLMPSIRLADEIDCAPDDDNTATVRPDCSRSATAAARAWSIERSFRLLTGRMSSNAGRSSSSESTSTEINCPRCDAPRRRRPRRAACVRAGKAPRLSRSAGPRTSHARPASRAAGCFLPARVGRGSSPAVSSVSSRPSVPPDTGHAQRVGAQNPGVDDDRVDFVQASQAFRPQGQDRVLVGQSAAQGRGECLRCGPAGLGGGYLHRGGGHGQIAGAGTDRTSAQGLQQRETTRGPLDRS